MPMLHIEKLGKAELLVQSPEDKSFRARSWSKVWLVDFGNCVLIYYINISLWTFGWLIN